MSSKAVIAANLRSAMEKSGMSARAVVDAADVSNAYLYEVLSAKKAPTVDWLERVSNALGIQPFELLKPGRGTVKAPAKASKPAKAKAKKKKSR